MLRDELLRAKNDEIARCLSSRKRKLSELYFATVGFAGATDESPEGELYRQKEAAFLDANDITQGRFYNESTLPNRADVAIITPTAEDHNVSPEESNAGAAETAGITSDVSAGVPVPPTAEFDVPSTLAQQDGLPETCSTSLTTAGAPGQDDGARRLTSSPGSRDVGGPEKESSRGEQSNYNGSEHQFPTHPLHPHSVPTPGDAAALGSPTEIGATKHARVKGSPALVTSGPPVKHNEGMSPASSWPSSTHTSATETSPKSSSTEESLVQPLDTSSVPKLQEDSHPLAARRDAATPNKVPVTPDEQLRLETAMSYQDSSEEPKPLPAHPGYEPSSMEERKPAQATQSGDTVALTDKATRKDGDVNDPSTDILQNETGYATHPALGPSQAPAPEPEPGPQSLPATPTSPPDATRLKDSADTISEQPFKRPDGARPRGVSDYMASDAALASAQRARTDGRVSPSLGSRRQREKPRNRLSTVVFPKQQSTEKGADLVHRTHHSDSFNEEQDYLYALFQAKAHYPPRSMNLNSLLSGAHKTLTTSNHFLEYEEQMNCRTLKRIYQLQNANKWPLRQLQRSSEPQRSETHWDVLLDHTKWMSTDFKEERRWKITAAKACADWCAEYIASDEEGRSMLRVKSTRKPRNHGRNIKMMPTPGNEGHMEEQQEDSHPTPDLIPSMDDDSVSEGFNDDQHPDIDNDVSPAGIFALSSDEFTFRMEKTPASDKILDELPLYEPVGLSGETRLPSFKLPPDTAWNKELLPVSKYATAGLELENAEPPFKRSRYDHSTEKSGNNEGDDSTIPIPPDQTDIALFQPENKHIRDRIHPGHSFRPPIEHAMPSLGFYEARQSSQWTYSEDDELRRLVREYSYNWSLISSCLSPQTKFSSGADRRTPWECFERWIGLEGLPADMAKTPYFRAYSARLEAAQRTVLAAQQAAQQQQQQQSGNNSAPQPLARRRTTQPVRVERKRTTRHLALLAGMRKLSQKREALVQKQQHATHLASLRKANEANQPRPPISTPAEFSRLKFEREVKYQERSEQYRQHMIQQQRAALAQRVAQHQANQPMPNGMQGRNPNAIPAAGAGQPAGGNIPPGGPNGLPANGAMGPGRSQVQGMPNGVPANAPVAGAAMPMKMSQSVQQQPVNNRPGTSSQGSPDNARIIREANRVQEQQRLVQSRQQQHQFHAQQPPFGQQGPHSSPNMSMSTPNTNTNNPSIMAAFQAASSAGSPSFHAPALAQGVSASSPRPSQPNPISNTSTVPNTSTLQHSLQRNHPNIAPEQANKLSNERLQQYQQHRMSQAAMNAAAGNIGSMPPNYQMPPDPNAQQVAQSGVPNGTPPIQASQTQGYSPLMRVAQPGQASRLGVNGSPAMNGMAMQQSRNATPQPNKPGGSQSSSATGQGQSPRPPQAQTATS